MKGLVSQSCPTLCNPMYCPPPGSSVHGISQARKLEWVAIPFSRGSSKPRDQTLVSCIGRWILYHWATREASWLNYYLVIQSESRSDVPDSLQPHGPYSPWNSPGQNTGVGCLFLLQGIFPIQGLNPGSRIVGGFLTSWATREATREVIW